MWKPTKLPQKDLYIKYMGFILGYMRANMVPVLSKRGMSG